MCFDLIAAPSIQHHLQAAVPSALVRGAGCEGPFGFCDMPAGHGCGSKGQVCARAVECVTACRMTARQARIQSLKVAFSGKRSGGQLSYELAACSSTAEARLNLSATVLLLNMGR